MNLANPITLEHVQQRKQEIMAKFSAATHSSLIQVGQLERLHSQISKRQNELVRLISATQRQISKYFLTFQPMKCNPATFADLRLYGGPRIALNHGKLYIGTIVDGKRHGKGLIISQKGKIYEGQLLLNERNGVGVEIYQNANFYIGGFSASKREGEGKMVWANTTSHGTTFQYYVGKWKNGEPHGQGIHCTENWNFVGNFKQGVRYGKGIEIKAGIIYEGTFVNNLREGKGMLIEEGVEFYEGDFKGGRKNGYGKLRCLKTGEQYQGFFQNNKREGIGACLKDGLLYRGLFTEDKPNGTGEYIKTASLLTKELENISLTEQEVKKSPIRSRGELQSAQFVRSNKTPVLQTQQSTKSLQKISRPPKMAKINTSRDNDKEAQKRRHSQSERNIKLKSRASLASAKIVRVNDNPERHACSYKHCSCHKWEQNEAEKLKIDEKRILRLFSARKSLLKNIV